MFSGHRTALFSCFALILSAALPVPTHAERTGPDTSLALSPELTAEALPDAPVPQVDIATSDIMDDPGTQLPASTPAGQGSSQAQSSSNQQTTPAPEGSAESKKDEAEQQMKQEEKQRVLGVVPNFNITYLGSATVSLTAKQKFTLAAHTITDPVTFITPFFVAGYHEIRDDESGFAWGVKGLGERAGAAYLDSVTGTMLGDAILPSILHQDPRYFRMGYGTFSHRFFYALSTNVRARDDKTGKWVPNYSNVGGNILSGAISNLYYPNSNSGIGLTISNGLIQTCETGLGSLFYEFWPDVSRKVLHKDPTHGLDAQARSNDDTKKQNKTQKQ